MAVRDDGAVRRTTSRDRRIGVLAALSWALAVVVTGAVAERAVAVLDASSTRPGVLSQAEVADALATARAGASPTGTATPTATPTRSAPAGPTGAPSTAPATTSPPVAPPTHPAARPTTTGPTPEVARTWTVVGGTVEASCQGTVIGLVYATPQDGWTVDVRSAGPDQIKVELKMAEQETTVTATCVGGVPQQSVTGPTHDSAPGTGGSDD